MHICHISDTHLGAGETFSRRAKSGLTERQEDIINSFVEAVDLIIEEKPDICIHAGDLFHTVRPTNKMIQIAVEQFHKIAEVNKIPTVIISGNHDAPKQPHIGAALDIFKHIKNLYVSAGIGLEVFEVLDAKIFALPHCLTTKIQKEELAKCVPDSNFKYNILIMHGVAAGMPEFSMAELGEQELPLETMNRFDYTALGHYHNFVQVAPRAFYSGSTERLSQQERDHDKGYLRVNLEPFDVELVKVKSREMVDLEPIKGEGLRGDKIAEIIKEKLTQVDSSDKIVRLKVEGVTEETLKTMPSSVINELKQKSFALNINFEKEKKEEENKKIGRTSIGQLDKGFMEFLEAADLNGFDKELLLKKAMAYLSEEE